MKTNYITKLKDKVKSTNYSFSQNLYYHLIIPAVVIVLAIIFACTGVVNKGLEFGGGTAATVIVGDLDLNVSQNYSDTKEKIDDVLKQFRIEGVVYQKSVTNYYGNALTVKFENSKKLNATIREEIEKELIKVFYPTNNNQFELETFVKVEEFGPSVSGSVLLSSALAIILALVCAFIYLAIRYGFIYGMIVLCVGLLDVVTVGAFTLVLYIKIDSNLFAAFAMSAIYSILTTLLMVTKLKENVSKEKFTKSTNYQVANETIRQSVLNNTMLSVFVLIFALLLGSIPTTMVRLASLPLMVAVFVTYFSSIYITPGLWALTYKRKVRKAKTEKIEVTTEEKIENIHDIDSPEIIVETEVKEKTI